MPCSGWTCRKKSRIERMAGRYVCPHVRRSLPCGASPAAVSAGAVCNNEIIPRWFGGLKTRLTKLRYRLQLNREPNAAGGGAYYAACQLAGSRIDGNGKRRHEVTAAYSGRSFRRCRLQNAFFEGILLR